MKTTQIPAEEINQRNVLSEALDGARGPDQQRIAAVGLEWIYLLLTKNADYGSSAWKSPILCPTFSPDTAIRVRMSDKIERLRTILDHKTAETSESLEDTIRDLGAYCLLWLTRPDQIREYDL